MNDSTLRVALYARVSSDQQAKAATIESQLSAIEERITQDTHVLDDELRFIDDGYTGSTLLRPALEQLRDVAYAGAIDVLYVHSPDRLARKYAYQVLLIDEFKKSGVEVVFLNHAIDKTPEGELLLQMQGMIAEYERAKILERSRRGKRHAARRGSVNVLSGAPYGYRYVSVKETGGEARYEIIPDEARVVAQVFEWVGVDSLSIGEVRRRLHEQGIKTRTGKEWWDRATIWGMLKNPAYMGSAGFGKTRIGERLPQLRPQRGQAEQPRKAYSVYATTVEEQEFIPVPALISEALFDSIAEQLVENKQRNRQGRRGARYLLQGLLKCACCGYSFYGKPSRGGRAQGKTRRYTYYRCIGMDAYRFGGNRICDNKQVRTSVLEEAVWEDVSSLLRDPERIQQEYHRRLADDNTESSLALKQNEATISKVKRAIVRLIDAYEDDLLTKEELEPRVRQSKNRLTQLEAEHAKLSGRVNEQEELRRVINHLDEFSQQLSAGIETLDWIDKRKVIRALVKRVEIGKKDVRVVYKIGQLPFVQGPASGASLQDCLRRHHRSLWRPHGRTRPLAVLRDPCNQPFTDETQNPAVGYSVLEDTQHPCVVNGIKETTDVGVKHPVHLALGETHVQRIQRVVVPSSRPKPIAEPEKVLLVYLLQNNPHGLLDNLVFQGRNAQGTQTSIRLGNVLSLGGLCPVGTAMNPLSEVLQIGFQIAAILMPRHSVHPRSCALLQIEEARFQEFWRHVVQQGGEPCFLISTCGHSYAQQAHSSPLSRPRVRCESSPLCVSLG